VQLARKTEEMGKAKLGICEYWLILRMARRWHVLLPLSIRAVFAGVKVKKWP